MKKLFTSLALISLSLFTPALASEVQYKTASPFIPVTLDSAPGELYHLGYLLDDHTNIVGVYYQNTFATDPSEQFKTFAISDAEKGVVLEQKTNGGKTYDLIRMQVALQSDNTVKLTLDYLKNGLFNSRAFVLAGVRFNTATAKFEAFDLNSKKAIQEAQIFVKLMGGQQVGIDRIVFQY